jgi:hypothetical protein
VCVIILEKHVYGVEHKQETVEEKNRPAHEFEFYEEMNMGWNLSSPALSLMFLT